LEIDQLEKIIESLKEKTTILELNYDEQNLKINKTEMEMKEIEKTLTNITEKYNHIRLTYVPEKKIEYVDDKEKYGYKIVKVIKSRLIRKKFRSYGIINHLKKCTSTFLQMTQKTSKKEIKLQKRFYL
jgi:hypothetical protein